MKEGELCSGSLRGSNRGREPPGSGAALWDRPADGSEDAGVFGAAWLPAEPAPGAPEAGSVHRDHRQYPGGGRGSSAEAAAYLEAGF